MIPWAEWKARELNQITRGSITASTVRHGEQERDPVWDSRAQGIHKEQLRRTSKRQWKGLAAEYSAP
jgi:uncharacterized protein (DUF427 family)